MILSMKPPSLTSKTYPPLHRVFNKKIPLNDFIEFYIIFEINNAKLTFAILHKFGFIHEALYRIYTI